jgi:beta-lactamase regulating signal transducer with metallopeptidase domain
LHVRRLLGIIHRSERVADELVVGWSDASIRPSTLPVVDVRRSAEVHTPCLARAWRPVLLLPEPVGTQDDCTEMRAILAHELAHARNHDLAWNDALHVLSMLLWFHP